VDEIKIRAVVETGIAAKQAKAAAKQKKADGKTGRTATAA
jgi:hypothetical protein